MGDDQCPVGLFLLLFGVQAGLNPHRGEARPIHFEGEERAAAVVVHEHGEAAHRDPEGHGGLQAALQSLLVLRCRFSAEQSKLSAPQLAQKVEGSRDDDLARYASGRTTSCGICSFLIATVRLKLR